MALERAVAGALTHAELVEFLLHRDAQLDQAVAEIVQLRAQVAQLQARIRDLEAERDRNDPTTKMPGLKPAATPRRRKTGPRKGRAHGFSRPRMAPTETTEMVVHAADVCPDCATPLSGGWERWRRQVLEVPDAPIRVIEHVVLARRCPRCQTTVLPPTDAASFGVVGPQHRLGIGLVSRIAVLRAELRLPVALIQWYLLAVYGLELSAGAVVGALRTVAQAGAAPVQAILTRIRAGPAVHADETGWREDGTNGSLWSFSTPTERYFVRGGRTKQVVDAVLGLGQPDGFVGVLSTDVYAAYDHYDGPHQRCWGHLLRDVQTLRERHPKDAVLQQWAADVHAVYTRARQFVADAADVPAADRARAQRGFAAELLALCAPFLAADKLVVPQAVLCRRVQKYLPELFLFVAEPATVPSDNNAAERSIRPAVCQRKISGGTRSPAPTPSPLWPPSSAPGAPATWTPSWPAVRCSPKLPPHYPE